LSRPPNGRPAADHYLDGLTLAPGRSVLIFGRRGGGHRDVLQTLERRAIEAGQRVEWRWVTPDRPRLMFALALGELLGVEELGSLEVTQVVRHLRQAMRDIPGEDYRFILRWAGVEAADA